MIHRDKKFPNQGQNRIFLNCESLESREVLSSTVPIASPMESVSVAPVEISGPLISGPSSSGPTNGTPSGWSTWSNSGLGSIYSTNPESSSGLNFVSTGISSSAARAWIKTTTSADVAVSAQINVNSLIPVGIIVRGSNLNTNTPTYYSATMTRGLDIEIQKTLDGVTSTLAILHSKPYITSTFITLGLSVQGDQLSVSIQSPTTQLWLDHSGSWQSTQQTAIQVNDNSITTAGEVGLLRQNLYAGSVLINQFSEQNLTSSPSTTNNNLQPNIPQKIPYIRIAQLAYGSTPLDSASQQLLRSKVDLVIPNTSLLNQISSISPTTPSLIYVNFSNLYGSLLASWVQYATSHGIDPESAFYHVSKPTAWTGSSPSSIPVSWFWNVQLGPSNLSTNGRFTYLSEAAHNGTKSVIGGINQSLYIGYVEPFAQINFQIQTPASGNWQGVLEYATKVNSSGQPTDWSTLTTVSDSTSNFRKNGSIQFNPPANWQMSTISGSTSPLYYIRLRTTQGSSANAPVVTSILASDYAGANGKSQGTIPVYDYAADTNHTGYLNNTQYAQAVAAGQTARFAYQSRLFYPYYGQMRFVVNPASQGYQQWAIQYAKQLLQQNPKAAGLFVDNSAGNLPTNGASVVESVANYTSNYANLLAKINQAIAPNWLIANTAGSYTTGNQVVKNIPGSFQEFALRPLSASWAQFLDTASFVAQQQSSRTPAPYLVLDSLPTGGSPTDSRTQLATLAYYYLLGNPKTTFLMFYGGYSPSTSWTQHWSNAVNYNVGQPQGNYTLLTTGKDPANTKLTYNVYERNYTNALVLYKPLSYQLGVGTGTTANNTATTIKLDGWYRPVNADGTLGAQTNTISLRNGEGAILAKVNN